jgi:ParB family transcriptional regulator, chromosome partitioning protein
MAKRRRLTPPRDDYLAPTAPAPSMRALPGSAPPISSVAGDAATNSALLEVAGELTAARSEGRLLLRLPLDQIDEGWLVRDRISHDEEALESLIASLRSHGQRSPIEVTELAPGRYGLISGWRRLTALRRLHAELSDAAGQSAYAAVTAIQRRPDSAEAAYVAMVEENEIRLGLSYFERARIAAKAVEAGVFPTEKLALQKLYATASRAKRSKIGSFLSIYHGLQTQLRFASALPERLGLVLARALETDAGLAARLGAVLQDAAPASAEQEQALLMAAIAPPPKPATKPAVDAPSADELRPGLILRAERVANGTQDGRIVLQGAAVTPELLDRLRHWLHGEA